MVHLTKLVNDQGMDVVIEETNERTSVVVNVL